MIDETHSRDVAVIIPWRHTPDRARLIRYVCDWWERAHGLTPHLGMEPDEPRGLGPWRKGVAIEAGIASALRARPSTCVFVIADADVIMKTFDSGISEAIGRVRAGHEAWAVPHLDVHRHPEPWTADVIAGGAGAALPDDPDVVIHRGHPGGGLVVINREIAAARCLPDPRFAGWGQEDDSWAYALRTLYGVPWRGKGPLHHLWHKPQERLTRAVGSAEGAGLFRDYVRARLNVRLMRSLVDSGWRWWDDQTGQAEGQGS